MMDTSHFSWDFPTFSLQIYSSASARHPNLCLPVFCVKILKFPLLYHFAVDSVSQDTELVPFTFFQMNSNYKKFFICEYSLLNLFGIIESGHVYHAQHFH